MSAIAKIRRLLPFLTIAILIALVYDGWIFYSRWDRARRIERQRAEKEAADARRILDLLGGGDLKILNFYAVPNVITRGSQANLCYSVISAKRVRIEPPIKNLYPALSYCFQISPRNDTEYKLFAEDDAGNHVSATLAVRVRARTPH